MNQNNLALHDVKAIKTARFVQSECLRFFFGLIILFFCILQTQAQTLDFSKKTTSSDFLSKKTLKVSSSYSTEQVKAELLLYAPEPIQAGSRFWVGLQLRHAPHWHTYWKNSGDSGLPTELIWTLPTGWKASGVIWPLAKKIPIGPLANFGYENEVLLLSTIQLPANLVGTGASTIPLQLHAKWLVCSKECIPQEGNFEISISLEYKQVQHKEIFERAMAQVPQALKPTKNNQLSVNGRELELRVVNLPAAWRGKKISAMPETPEIIQMSAEPQQIWKNSEWMVRIPLSKYLGSQPSKMAWVLAPEDFKPTAMSPALRIELPVQGEWLKASSNPLQSKTTASTAASALEKVNQPSSSASATIASQDLEQFNKTVNTDATQASSSPDSPGSPSITPEASNTGRSSSIGTDFWFAIISALIGGVLLNLMPCVFPVLAIKVLHLTKYTHDSRQRKQSAIAYTLGVIISFLVLAALLLVLRAAGEGLGWGFQLQNPSFVIALTVLFLLIALNLWGVFEWGHWLPNSWASWQSNHPMVNSFMTGVLAVAVASPCTAPFMGASLGFAIHLPVPMALSVFFALGLGLALPYLLAGFWPGMARYIPQPGAWMETFKQALAFPMLATTVWLIGVLGQQNGFDAAIALLMCLLILAFLIWCLQLKGQVKRWLMAFALLLSFAAFYVLGPVVVQHSERQPTTQDKQKQLAAGHTQSGEVWKAWSPELQNQLMQQGKVVFVDYTAAWCVTCQVNKKTTLDQVKVLEAFQTKNIVLLRADWTKRDPVIEQSLAKLGRSGVPVYVFYQKGKPALILSELLTPSEVISAIESFERS